MRMWLLAWSLLPDCEKSQAALSAAGDHDHGPGTGRAAGRPDGRWVAGRVRAGAGRQEEEAAHQDGQAERREGGQGQGDAQAHGRRKKVLKKKGKITQKMRITFTPTGGTPKSSTKTITIKRKVKKK
jgi:hypothetical protein